MQSPTLMENIYEPSANAQSRIDQLEDTIVELYQSVCTHYGTIDFAQVPPEDFDTPFSMHSMLIPTTELSVNLTPTPPHLVIGTPASHTPGPLHWEHELKIEFPGHTTFVSFPSSQRLQIRQGCFEDESGAASWRNPPCRT